MSITNPAQLVAEYKKSGEFDRLRREMLSDFQKSEAVRPLLSRVEDITRQKLQADRKLEYLPQESVHRELIAELDRYPLVERAVGEFRARSERLYPSEVRAGLRNLLRDSRKGETKGGPTKKVEESTKPPATATANAVQPVSSEEQAKKRQAEIMDVEQTGIQPPKETSAGNPAKERLIDHHIPTDGEEVEEGSYVH